MKCLHKKRVFFISGLVFFLAIYPPKINIKFWSIGLNSTCLFQNFNIFEKGKHLDFVL